MECSEAVKKWEPVREAAGIGKANMSMWCNIGLQPVLEAYAASQTDFTHLNMSVSRCMLKKKRFCRETNLMGEY